MEDTHLPTPNIQALIHLSRVNTLSPLYLSTYLPLKIQFHSISIVNRGIHSKATSKIKQYFRKKKHNE